jgi:hypothetical protein
MPSRKFLPPKPAAQLSLPFTLTLRNDMPVRIVSNTTSKDSTSFAYSIGCDPELFLVDSTGNFRSAHDLIPGDKFQPMRVTKGAIQPDGTSAEFNIDPATSDEEFCANIKAVLVDLSKHLKEKAPGLTLRVSPVADFEANYFNSLPPEALAFGCTPDFNAWTEKRTEFPGTTLPFRTGAGHVHVGWTEHADTADDAHFFDCIEATKQLDAVLYPMSLLWDPDKKRRTLYGKMGAFRPKHYGVEYRPLSNAWVADPDLQKWVFNATRRAMELLDSKVKQVKLWEDKDLGHYTKIIRDGLTIMPSELRATHEILVDDLGFQPLPKAYRPLAF